MILWHSTRYEGHRHRSSHPVEDVPGVKAVPLNSTRARPETGPIWCRSFQMVCWASTIAWRSLMHLGLVVLVSSTSPSPGQALNLQKNLELVWICEICGIVGEPNLSRFVWTVWTSLHGGASRCHFRCPSLNSWAFCWWAELHNGRSEDVERSCLKQGEQRRTWWEDPVLV